MIWGGLPLLQRGFVEAATQLLAPGARVFLQSDVLEVRSSAAAAVVEAAACLKWMRELALPGCRAWQAALPAGHTLTAACWAPPSSPLCQVAEHMRDKFEQHGSSAFAPCPVHHVREATFHAASPPPEDAAGAAGAAAAAATSDGGSSSAAEGSAAWQSQWAAAGWLRQNPLVRTQASAVREVPLLLRPRVALCSPCMPSCCAWPIAARCARPAQLKRAVPLPPSLQGVPTEREVATVEQDMPVYRVLLVRQ